METSQKEIAQESLLSEWVRMKVFPIFTKTPKLSIIQGLTLLIMAFLLTKALNVGSHPVFDLLYLMMVILDGVETTYYITQRKLHPIILVGWILTTLSLTIYLFHH